MEDVYPLVRHQLCWVHKLANIARRCPVRYRSECMIEVKRIMRARSEGVAVKLFRSWKKKWHKLVPGPVKCLEDDFDKLIQIFGFLRRFAR